MSADPEAVLRALVTVYVDDEPKYRAGIVALEALLDERNALRETDSLLRGVLDFYGGLLPWDWQEKIAAAIAVTKAAR